MPTLTRDDSVALVFTTCNATDRISLRSLGRVLCASDVVAWQQASTITPALRDACRANGFRLILTDHDGAAATPLAYRVAGPLKLRNVLWVPGVTDAAGGPFVSKDKGWQGGRFGIPEIGRRVDVFAGHMPYNQDDSPASARAADVMAARIRGYAHGRKVGTLLGIDGNERASRVPLPRPAGWSSDQLELRELATRKGGWAPDHVWGRSTPRLRVEFLDHDTIPTESDHDALRVALRLHARNLRP